MSGLIAHEWISARGGSENVVHSMLDTFKDVDLFCLWDDTKDRFWPGRTRESWIAKTPLRGRKALSLPFMPAIWSDMDIGNAEWLIASSHLFAHHAGAANAEDIPTLNYVHSPARYLWVPSLDQRGASPLVRAVAPPFRRLDRKRARTHKYVVTNSEYVRQRVHSVWGIDASVLYPPVAVERIQAVPDWAQSLSESERVVLESLPDSFILGASRFVPYKKLDLVIRAAEILGLPVVISGGGPLQNHLEALIANSTVPARMVLDPSDSLLFALYQRASVYVFPPIEDFGIMPVEAMAAGVPVVVNALGGARESVNSEDVGATFEGEHPAAVAAAIKVALGASRAAARARATAFSESTFRVEIQSHLENVRSA